MSVATADWPLFIPEAAWENPPSDGDPFDDFALAADTVLRRSSSGALWAQSGKWVNDGSDALRLATPSQRLVIADTFRKVPAGTVTLNGRVDQAGKNWTVHLGTMMHGTGADPAAIPAPVITTVGPSIATCDAGSPDGTCSCIYTNGQVTTLAANVGLILRYVDENNYLRVSMVDASTIRVTAVAAGVATVIATASQSVRWATGGSGSNICWLRADIRGRRIRVWYARMRSTTAGVALNTQVYAAEQTDIEVIDYTMSSGEAAPTAKGTRFGLYQSTNVASRGFISFHHHADSESLAVITGPSFGTITTSIDAAQDGHAVLFRYQDPYNLWYVEQREANAGVTDNFNRADNASVPGGGWTTTLGVAGIQTNRLYFPTAPGRVQQPGVADGVIQATAAVVTADQRLRFRISDYTNGDRWELIAVPAFGVWNLNRVRGGIATFVANTAGSGCASGDVLRVELDGPRIRIYVNNVLRITITDPTYQHASLVGLSAADTTARWDDFSTSTTAGLRLVQRLADVDTVIDTWDGTPTGDLAITLDGDDIAVQLNGALVLDASDSDLATANGCGFRGLRGEGAGRFGPINCELGWTEISLEEMREESATIVRGVPFETGNVDPAAMNFQLFNWDRIYEDLITKWARFRLRYQLVDSTEDTAYHGFVNHWTHVWEDESQTIGVGVECTDAAGVARQTPMRNPYPDLAIIDRPVAYVRLRDVDPELAIMDESGTGITTTGAAGGNGTRDQILNGDDGTGYVDPAVEFPLDLLPLGRPSVAFSFLYDADFDAGSVGTFILFQAPEDADDTYVALKLSNFGATITYESENSGTPAAVRSKAQATGDAGSVRRTHHIGVQQNAVSNLVEIFIDGVLAGSQIFYGALIDHDYTDAGYEAFHTIGVANTAVSELKVYDHCLTAEQWAALAATSGLKLEGQTGDERLHQIGDSLPGTSRRTIPVCAKPLVHARITGVDDIDIVANGEDGLAFFARPGDLRLRTRTELDAQAVVAEWGDDTLTDNGNTGQPKFDTLPKLTKVIVTRPGLDSKVARNASKPWESKEETIDTWLQDDSDATDLAETTATRFATDRLLVREVPVNPLTFQQWPVILGLELGDKVRFLAAPNAVPTHAATDSTSLLSRVSHQRNAFLDWEASVETMLI